MCKTAHGPLGSRANQRLPPKQKEAHLAEARKRPACQLGRGRTATAASPSLHTAAGVYQLINNGRLAPSHPHLQLPAHEENALSMPNFGDALGGGAGGELRLQQPLASAYAVSLGQVGAAWSSWLVLVPPELAIPGSSGRASEGSGLFSALESTPDPTERLAFCRKTPYMCFRRG